MVKQNSQLNLIQVLRGIASLLVVFFHISANTQEVFNKNFCFNLFLFGGSGVDIFFVLSGFIITYTSSKGISHLNKLLPFLRRRFIRIFPTYWIITGLFLLVQIIFPAFYKTHYDFSIENLLSTWFLIPGHTMVNGVSWTLSYELFFYILFSFAFIIPNKKIAFFLSMLYALIIISIPLLSHGNGNANRWTDLAIFPMNVEFFMGVLAAVIIPRIPQQLSLPLIITGILIYLTSAIFFDNNYHLLSGSFNRVVVFGIPSFLIITGLVKLEKNRHISVHNILLSLGEASYSLYLLHLPIVVAGIRIIARFNVENIFILHVLLLLLTAFICYASILFYKWVEKPLINKLNAL